MKKYEYSAVICGFQTQIDNKMPQQYLRNEIVHPPNTPRGQTYENFMAN